MVGACFGVTNTCGVLFYAVWVPNGDRCSKIPSLDPYHTSLQDNCSLKKVTRSGKARAAKPKMQHQLQNTSIIQIPCSCQNNYKKISNCIKPNETKLRLTPQKETHQPNTTLGHSNQSTKSLPKNQQPTNSTTPTIKHKTKIKN